MTTLLNLLQLYCCSNRIRLNLIASSDRKVNQKEFADRASIFNHIFYKPRRECQTIGYSVMMDHPRRIKWTSHIITSVLTIQCNTAVDGRYSILISSSKSDMGKIIKSNI